MGGKLRRFLEGAAALGTAALVAACLVWRAQTWAGEKGAGALLFAAGLGVEEASPSPAPEKEAEPVPTPAQDGVAPYPQISLPQVQTTPDPNRDYAPVEETVIAGGQQVGDFTVKDTTGSGTDLLAELEAPCPVEIQGDGSVEVLLYHTHTSEAYSQDFTGFYYTDMATRTEDPEQSVVAVGEEIRRVLESYGIGAVHDTTVNDTLYNGSYARSWETLQRNLEAYPTIQVTVDIHRDSMTTEEGVKYKPTVEIGGEKAAQIMFLAGCDADGSWGDFPLWRENLRFILRLQQTAARLYPCLARPMSFSNSKYNMNATTGSVLVEVGTEVNTVAEARHSGKLIGEILAKTLLEAS